MDYGSRKIEKIFEKLVSEELLRNYLVRKMFKELLRKIERNKREIMRKLDIDILLNEYDI